MDLRWTALDLPYKHGHFTISAEKSERARTILVAACDGEGRIGLGEAAPSMRVTGQDSDVVHSRLQEARTLLAKIPLGSTQDRPQHPFGPARGPAACAVDGALYDLWARTHDQPLWKLLGLPRPSVPTSSTISLGTKEEMAAEALSHTAQGFQILKIKLGARPEEDLPRIQAIREAVPRATLRVDGNEGWTLDDAVTLLPAFAEAGVELLEQPLRRDVPDETMQRLTKLAGDHDIAHVLDERIHGPDDVETIARGKLAHGVNLKLQKAGGLTNGLRVIETAQELDLRVMIGCFIESWAGIALALQPCGLVDWVDLDGAWLLAEEPVVPDGKPLLQDGVLTASDTAGIGVVPGPRLRHVFDEPTTSL